MKIYIREYIDTYEYIYLASRCRSICIHTLQVFFWSPSAVIFIIDAMLHAIDPLILFLDGITNNRDFAVLKPGEHCQNTANCYTFLLKFTVFLLRSCRLPWILIYWWKPNRKLAPQWICLLLWQSVLD